MSLIKPKNKIFYGWFVLAACAIIQFYFGGTFFQGFTAIFNPISAEFGWSAALVSLAFTFRGFESGALAPIVGFFVERFGAKKMLFTGVVVMCLGFWVFSRINNLISFYLVFLLLSFGLSLASGVVTMTIVAEWFKERRSLAMGILTAGFGLSGSVVPAVVWIVDKLDWRTALMTFGAVGLIIGLPLSLLVKNPPRASEPLVAQENSNNITKAQSKPIDNEPKGGQVKQVIRNRNFWFLSFALMCGGIAGLAITVFQIPYMVSIGISRQTASYLVVVLAFSNTGGRMLFGWLGDKMNKRLCFVISSVVKAAGVLWFAYSTQVYQFIPALIVMGIGFGGLVPLRPILQIEYFGMRSFAVIQGLLMAALTVGSIVATPFAGLIYDTFHEYRIAFVVLGVITLAAVPLIMATSKTT
jgi:MFS family permease